MKSIGLPLPFLLCFKAAWMRRPGLSMLKRTSLCVLPWQSLTARQRLRGKKSKALVGRNNQRALRRIEDCIRRNAFYLLRPTSYGVFQNDIR
jgi:hypothetical protein